MTWTVSRNNSINGAADVDRAKQTICLIKDRLKACVVPWTVIGSGTGAAGAFSMAGVDLLPVFPSVVGMNNGAWICLQNAAGAQIILQHDSASVGRIYFYLSGTGGYQLTADASATLRPGNATPPAGEVPVNPTTANYREYGAASAHYKSVAVEDNGNAFICFGTLGVYAAFHLALYQVTGDPADTSPYLGVNIGYTSDMAFDYSQLTSVSIPGATRAYHPAGSPASPTNYLLEEPQAGTTFFMIDMPPNPFSGKQQLLGVFAVSITAGRRHVKGGLNGILRVPGQRTTGDTFESGALVCMNDYAVPWESGSVPLL